jgi:hypothetical protein
MTTFIAHSRFGTFQRNSKTKSYAFAVVRTDGWHTFSQTKESADREANYQRNKGRDVDLVPVVTA